MEWGGRGRDNVERDRRFKDSENIGTYEEIQPLQDTRPSKAHPGGPDLMSLKS